MNEIEITSLIKEYIKNNLKITTNRVSSGDAIFEVNLELDNEIISYDYIDLS